MISEMCAGVWEGCRLCLDVRRVACRHPGLTSSAARRGRAFPGIISGKHFLKVMLTAGLPEETEPASLQPALLLAEEKILVPNTDKDIKCFCPQGGGRRTQPL